MEDLVDLVRAASSVDISFINGQYHVEVVEMSGKQHLFKGIDLAWLIHNIRDELLIWHMQKFIFLHIPKTAGVSFNSMLLDASSKFGGLNYFHFRPRDARTGRPTPRPDPCKTFYPQYVQAFRDKIANNIQVGGHIRRADISNITNRDLITIIRHPVDRMISHYHYFQKADLESRNHYMHHNATNQMSLIEFAEKNRNFISKWIGDPTSYKIIGVQEYFPQFLEQFSQYLGIEPLVNRHENKTINKMIVSTKDRHLIESMNDIDMELYNQLNI